MRGRRCRKQVVGYSLPATWARQRIPLTQFTAVSTTAPRKSAMREHDLAAKYLVLPPNIDVEDIVIEVNTKHCGEPFDDTSSTE